MSITAAVLGGLAVDAVASGVKSAMPSLSKSSLSTLAKASSFAQSDSLVDFTSGARVEPTMLFDVSLTTIPFISDVVATVHSLYSALYLMAINLDNDVRGVNIRSKLDKFNPDRSIIQAGREFLIASREDFTSGYTAALTSSQYIGLPRAGDLTRNEIFKITPSVEAKGDNYTDDDYEMVDDGKGGKKRGKLKDTWKAAIGKTSDMNKLLTDVSNLAVGKVFEVEIGSGSEVARVPVRISIAPMPATPANIQDIVTVGTYDTTFRARWREIRAGRAKFWRDGIFALDRIDAYAQSAMKDKSGYLKEMQRRSGKSAAAFALTGEPSPSTASAIIMIHSDTAEKMYRESGIDLDDYKSRQSLFERTYAMILCIVDPDWESATFYYRNMATSTKVRASEMKTSSKGNGADVMELMKVYMSGSAPGRL